MAYVDARDPYHDRCLSLLTGHLGGLVVPMLVIAEAAHLIQERVGAAAEALFLGDLAAGAFAVEPVEPADWLRIAELVARYRDLRLGTVDASVIVTAERLGIQGVATLDRRHFTVVRPRHCDAFALPLLD